MIDRIRNIFQKKEDPSMVIHGVFEKPEDCIIENSTIKVGAKARLIIGKGVKILNYRIVIEEGELIIGDHCMLHQANNPGIPEIVILKGSLVIGDHNVIRADISVRFGGKCTIGRYNCLNELTELRCDEQVDIGDFNMISYECMIYDTNTHVIYEPRKRREMTMSDFPEIGKEYEKPVTKAVSIGNDCWLGKRAVVLKGCEIGDQATVSACCVVTKSVPPVHIAYGNPAQHKSKS